MLTVAGGQGVLNGSTPSRQVIEGPKGRSAVLSRDARGRLRLEFSAGAVPAEAEAEVLAFVQQLLGRR